MKHILYIENAQNERVMPRGYKSLFRDAIALTLDRVGFSHRAEISVTVVSADEIRRLNREYRDTDRETDVLSFPMIEDFSAIGKGEWDGGAVLIGDVFICPLVIESQAIRFGTTFREEAALMVIHSVLHLLGMDHMKPDEKKAMFAMQENVLAELKTVSKYI